MAEVRLNALAIDDLAEIDEHGALEFGPSVAEDYARGFHDAFDLLRRHPLAGAAQPELGRGVRCIIHRKHRIFYIVKPDLVQILRIFHHSRNVQRSHLP
jgi:toxin ParE1/3/4